jgi:hypothetical protein
LRCRRLVSEYPELNNSSPEDLSINQRLPFSLATRSFISSCHCSAWTYERAYYLPSDCHGYHPHTLPSSKMGNLSCDKMMIERQVSQEARKAAGLQL